MSLDNRHEIARTTDLLDGDATFTSPNIPCRNAKAIRFLIFSDKASAANGLKINQSMDNSNFNETDSDSVAAGNLFKAEYTLYGTHINFTYKNSAAADQTTFRLIATLVY